MGVNRIYTERSCGVKRSGAALAVSVLGLLGVTSEAGGLDGGTTNSSRQVGYGQNTATIANGSLVAVGIGTAVETSAGGGISIGSNIVNNAASSVLIGNSSVSLDAGSFGSVVFNPSGAAGYAPGVQNSVVVTNAANGRLLTTYPSVFNSPATFAFSSRGPVVNSNGAINISGSVYDAAGGIAIGTSSLAGSPGVTSTEAPTALGNLAAASGNGSVALGANATASRVRGVALGADTIVVNDNSVALGNGSRTLAGAAVSSATVTTGGTALTFGGFAGASNVPSVVSVGNAGLGVTRQIVNMAPGAVSAASTDAVNGSQLYSVAQGLGTRVNTVAQDFSTQLTTVQQRFDGQVAAVNNRIDNLPPATVAGPDAQAQGAVMYSTNPDGTLDRANVALNPNGTPGRISNLADGLRDTDAVNVRQLNAAASSAVGRSLANTASNYAPPSALGSDAIALGSGSLAGGEKSVAVGNNAAAIGLSSTALGTGSVAVGNNSVALGASSSDGGRSNVVSVGSAGSERQVSNVAPGTQGTDAVNVNQLNQGLGAIGNNVNALREEVAGARRDANSGTAAAMALAGMPQASQPGKNMVGAGVSYYQGESAIAVGVSRMSESGQWVTKFSGTANSRGKVGLAVGVGYQF